MRHPLSRFPTWTRWSFRWLALGLALATSARTAPAETGVITPRETIVLFNGKDLANFYTWLGAAGPVDPKKTIHGRKDPDRVFTVVDHIDGAPAIRISGQHWGGLITNERYANYRLVAEFRWGSVTWGTRKNSLRDSGILLHCQGEDGSYKSDFRGAYMRSIEYQIIEGGTGDIVMVGGYERGQSEPSSPSLKSTVVPGPKHPRWSPNGTLQEFGRGIGTRIYWSRKDPDQRNFVGYRGRADAEKPAGEWNTLEAVCDGGDVALFVKMLFQSEGAEIFFRKIELHSLKK